MQREDENFVSNLVYLLNSELAEMYCNQIFRVCDKQKNYDRDKRVSNASIKNYFIFCTLAWNNRRLLELSVDFLQHITMVIMCRDINMVLWRRMFADNSSKLVLLAAQH